MAGPASEEDPCCRIVTIAVPQVRQVTHRCVVLQLLTSYAIDNDVTDCTSHSCRDLPAISADDSPVRYAVTRSPRAMLNDRRNNPQRYPLASAADMAWFELAESESQKKAKGGKKSVQKINEQKSEG